MLSGIRAIPGNVTRISMPPISRPIELGRTRIAIPAVGRHFRLNLSKLVEGSVSCCGKCHQLKYQTQPQLLSNKLSSHRNAVFFAVAHFVYID